MKNFGKGEGEEIQVAEGKFSFKTPEGNLISLTYIADENGFQPQVSISFHRLIGGIEGTLVIFYSQLEEFFFCRMSTLNKTLKMSY